MKIWYFDLITNEAKAKVCKVSKLTYRLIGMHTFSCLIHKGGKIMRRRKVQR